MNRMESASYARGASGRAPRVAAAGTGGRLTRAPGTIALPASVYWTGAPTLAVVLLYVIAVRLHELLPVLHYLRPALLSAAVALVLVMTRSTGAPLENAFRDTSYRIALAYVAWAGVTVPFALWRGGAIAGMQAIVPDLLLMLAILLCAPTRTNVSKLTTAFTLGVAAFAMVPLVLGTQNTEGRLEAAGSSFDTNDMAALMAMAFPFAVHGAMQRRGWMRFLYLGAALVTLLAIVQTGSRGGTLAVCAGALVLVMGLKGSRRFLVLALFVLAGFGAWQFGPKTFRERMESLTTIDQDYNETDFFGRKQIWKRGRMFYFENPVVGVGLGNFGVADGAYIKSIGRTGKWSAPHNAWIQAFAELGTLGGVLFTALLLVAGRRAYALWRASGPTHAPAYLASLAAFCAGAYFLSFAFFHAMFALVAMISVAWHTAQAPADELAYVTGGPTPPGAVAPRGSGWRSIASARRFTLPGVRDARRGRRRDGGS